MAYLADTHMHSIYSFDGQMCMEDMIKRGLNLDLKYISFTEHLELGQISIKQFLNRYKVYYDEIERLQEKYPNIKLIKGVEFTNPEKYPKELEIVNGLDIDYIIGSNHELPNQYDEKEILEYYKKILEIAKLQGIDSLGHMDYIRRKYDDSFVPVDLIKEIYSYLIENDTALEINSSAKRRKGLDSFPSRDRLKLYKEVGGEKVTIGSDAHRLNEIYDAISDVDKENDFDKGVYIKRKFISLNNRENFNNL